MTTFSTPSGSGGIELDVVVVEPWVVEEVDVVDEEVVVDASDDEGDDATLVVVDVDVGGAMDVVPSTESPAHDVGIRAHRATTTGMLDRLIPSPSVAVPPQRSHPRRVDHPECPEALATTAGAKVTGGSRSTPTCEDERRAWLPSGTAAPTPGVQSPGGAQRNQRRRSS